MTQADEGEDNDIAAIIAHAEEAAVADDASLDLKLSRLGRNDYGNAQRLLARHGRDLMYVHGAGWYYWDGRRWREDRGGHHAKQFAHKTALAIADELRAVRAEGPAAFRNDKAYYGFLDSLTKWARASGNAARVNAMVAEAAPYLERDINDLDGQPYLLTVRNGTLDLGGEEVVLLRHQREHLITRLADVDYDPAAGKAAFAHFMDTIMPEADMQAFLQRYYGYCLTGDVSEQKLLLSCGSGGNGKSTLNNALRAVFGEYATSIKFETLQTDDRRRGGEATPDIAELPGVRLVIAAEPENNVKLSTAIIKRFTGGEPIKARRLNESFFEFHPRFKLTLSFNEKPAVPAQDDGTWRRPMLVKFGRQIPEHLKDRHIDAKLAAQASGILNWLLDGFLEWREKGLSPPEQVVAATEQYRAENDPLGVFLQECVRKAPGKSVAGGLLYEAYRKWCDKNGIARPLTNTKFGTLLPQRGYEKVTKGTVTYQDVELADDGEKGRESSTKGWGYDDD